MKVVKVRLSEEMFEKVVQAAEERLVTPATWISIKVGELVVGKGKKGEEKSLGCSTCQIALKGPERFWGLDGKVYCEEHKEDGNGRRSEEVATNSF